MIRRLLVLAVLLAAGAPADAQMSLPAGIAQLSVVTGGAPPAAVVCPTRIVLSAGTLITDPGATPLILKC